MFYLTRFCRLFCQCSWKVNKIGISPWDWANSSSLKLSATPLATMAMMPTQAKLLHTVSMVTTASFSAMPSPPSQHVFCPLTAHTHQSDAQNSGTMTASVLCESFRFASQKSSAEPGLINVKSHPIEKKTWELEVSWPIGSPRNGQTYHLGWLLFAACCTWANQSLLSHPMRKKKTLLPY